MRYRTGLYPLALVVIAGLTTCSEPAPYMLEKLPITVSVIFSLPVVDTEDSIAQSETNPNLKYSIVTDIDNNVYETVQLFDKIWMAENLRTTRYNDSTEIIPGMGGPAGYTDWFQLDEGAYCWYNNDTAYKKTGALYNWHTIGTGRLCPKGWHVPSYQEWTELIIYTGGSVGDFNPQTENARITWGSYAKDFTNGLHNCLDGWGFLENGCWWTATPLEWRSYLLNVDYFGFEPASCGFNVRCVKDETSNGKP